MKFCYIDEFWKISWDELVQHTPWSGFMQSFFWADFKRRIGWDTYKIGAIEKKRLIFGAVVMKFHYSKSTNFLYVPEGPVMDFEGPASEDLFHQLMAEIDTVVDLEGKERTSHLRIEPRLFSVPKCFHRFQKAPYNMEPRDTLMIDLTATEDQILAQMKPKYRYNIKIAERENIEITVHDPSRENARQFSDIYKETVTRNKFEGKDQRYFETLFEYLGGTPHTKLFTAQLHGKVLAAALVIFWGDRATYFFGASSSAHRNKMSPYKLHWEVIRYSKQHRYSWYDLWGVAPKNASTSHGWYGLTQFKEKLGGERSTFIGAYDFIYNKKLYLEFLKESGEI